MEVLRLCSALQPQLPRQLLFVGLIPVNGLKENKLLIGAEAEGCIDVKLSAVVAAKNKSSITRKAEARAMCFGSRS